MVLITDPGDKISPGREGSILSGLQKSRSCSVKLVWRRIGRTRVVDSLVDLEPRGGGILDSSHGSLPSVG